MKYTISAFVLCIALCCCTTANAQWARIFSPSPTASFDTFVNQPGTTLRQITDTMRTMIGPNDTAEGGMMDQFRTFQKLWQQRVTVNDGSGLNMFQAYLKAQRAAVLAGRGACGGSGYQGTWQCIGPDSLTTQTAGKWT